MKRTASRSKPTSKTTKGKLLKAFGEVIDNYVYKYLIDLKLKGYPNNHIMMLATKKVDMEFMYKYLLDNFKTVLMRYNTIEVIPSDIEFTKTFNKQYKKTLKRAMNAIKRM